MLSAHTKPEKFQTRAFTLKTNQMFSVDIMPEKFETETFTLKTHQMFSVGTRPEKFEKRSVHSENASNIFRPQHAREI